MMKVVQKVEPIYVESEEAKDLERKFSLLDSVDFKKDRFVLTLHSSKWTPSTLGALSTLESPTEIVFTKRSQELECYPGRLSGFGGGIPFGLDDFEGWTRERVRKESNHLPRLEFLGLISDYMEGGTLLAYRGYVDKINRKSLPSVVKSEYGKVKYSELIVVPKTELREFLKKNKPVIVDSLEPVVSYITYSEQT
jgi:hypothetical protein